MKSPAGSRFAAMLLALVCASVAMLSAQPQSPTAANPAPRIYLVLGKIISLDESCTWLQLQPDGRKGPPTRFNRKPDKTEWQREAEGCSFNSLAGNKVLLKKGTEVSVRYSTAENENVLNWVVILGHGLNRPCTAQGGVERAPATLYDAGCDGIPEPKCLACRNPQYPDAARKRWLEGNVLLSVVILPDGSVSAVALVRGVEDGLDRNSIAAVKQWRFAPILGPEGHPVAARVSVEVTFRLV